MKRKWIALLSAAVLACSASGCGGGKTTGGDELNAIEIYQETYTPGYIETYYPTREPLIADAVVTREAADPTGVEDATAGIQAALDACAAQGGGTVFLPRGKYRLTSNVHIPSFVYLVGEYNDPDAADFNGYYGTVYLADVAPAETETRSDFLADRGDEYANFPALFTVGGSAGLIGATVWYPEQSAKNVIPYPFTVEIPSFAGPDGSGDHMAATVRDLTLLNSYKGVCASVTPAGDGRSAANEVLHLENVKGTALYQGMQLYNSSEVGVIRDVRFANSYWYGASAPYAETDLEALDGFTSLYGTGMLLGDLEWDTFTNITVENYRIGVRLSDGLRRFIPGQPEIYFIGQFYGLYALGCGTGLRVDDLYPNFGVNIAGGTLEGSRYAINDRYDGTSRIRLSGVKLTGAVYGDSVWQGTDEAYTELAKTSALPDAELRYPEPVFPAVFDVAEDFAGNAGGLTDTSVQIQSALDQAGALGGGIVYLRAGYYRVCSPLTVPAGVELRGAASANTRDQNGASKGTVIFGDAGYSADESTARTAQALITLAGDGAGVSGIRFIYPGNAPLAGGKVSFRWHSYVVRAVADGCYAKYLSFAGVPFGIEFDGSSSRLEGGYAIGINGTFYRNGLRAVDTQDLVVEEFLSNGAVMCRNDYRALFPAEFSVGWPTDGPLLTQIYDEITRPNSVLFALRSSTARIGNSFTFASNTVVDAEDSTVSVYNTAGDNLKLNGHLFRLVSSRLTAVNVMRYQGNMLTSDAASSAVMLNRLSLHSNTDNDYANGKELAVARLIDASAPDLDDTPPVYRASGS